METGRLMWLFVGGFCLLFGFNLIFMKVDKEALEKAEVTNPTMALFRFPAYRWAGGILCILFGIFSLILGFGWLK